ncbi:MAG: CheR family methyltransferase [Bacillota bacterium]
MKNRYFVGLGASAGGLESLQKFFKHIPSDTGLTFIVVQHLSPDYDSLMDELLARHTSMEIKVAENGMGTERNNIYLIPPRKNLLIKDKVLYLEEQKPKKNQINLPIDIFLQSLAKDQKQRAIGIILSGTGSDGTLGIKAIKQYNGMVIVEDVESAKFDGMPKSSISTGLVDYILKPNEMPKKLIKYVEQSSMGLQISKPSSDKQVDNLTKISIILNDYSGIDFSKYKESTMIRRTERRVLITHSESLEDYIQLLRESEKERETLFRELLIGVTNFFRDSEAFDALEEKVLPKLDFTKDQIRIWSAGCSTGEEIYSLAIMITEYMEKNNIKNCELKCFATDIDEEALEVAGLGFYSENVLTNVKSELIAKYFTKKENGYEISETIRKKVVFARHNILKDPPFSKLDLLVCRNLFIYLKSDYQQKILSNFYYALGTDGYLFLGNSETLGKMSDYFRFIDKKWKIYQFKKGYKPDISNKLHVSNSKLNLIEEKEKEKIKTNKSVWFEKLLLKVLEINFPPSILIDESKNILQVLGEVSKYIKIQPGRFSNKLSSNISRELGLFVNNVIRRLSEDQKSLVLNNIKERDNNYGLSIRGNLIELNDNHYYLVSFFEQNIDVEKDVVSIDMSDEEKNRIEELEIELQQAREGLQATIEELETSNEELQSSNEELVASNEELQSTNEELQSVNEELYTVNNEHQEKIEELSELNNDLNNLLKNTEIGALYLDSQLCIRRITPVFSEVTNLLETDIGRSIKHISVMDEYPELNDDIKTVMQDLDGIEREIQDEEGKYWLIRIRPFRTSNNAVNGVILTMVEITKLKSKQVELNKTSKRLKTVLEIENIAWWEYNVQTGYVKYSDTKATMLGYKPSEFPNDVYEICEYIHPDDYDETMKIMKDYLEGKRDDWDIKYRLKKKDGSYLKVKDMGKIIETTDDGAPLKLIGSVHQTS